MSPTPTGQDEAVIPASPAQRQPDPKWPSAATWLASASPATGRVDLAVIGVPAFATSISPTGAHATPAAVRRMLDRCSTWSASHAVDLADVLTALDCGDVDDPDFGDEGEWRTTTRVGTAAKMARLTVIIGGDNSVTYPAALGGYHGELSTAGLVTLDAHHDIRQGRSNGSPVRRLLEAGLAGERIVQVGIADWANSRYYADEAAARGITILRLHEVEQRGITECLTEALAVAGSAGGPIYVDLDLDVCDRSVAPGCPASLPGGLSAGEVLAAAYLAARDPQVVAVDITEVDATADPDGRTVRLAALCLLEAAAGLAARS